MQHRFQHRERVPFADPAHAAHRLPRCHRIHGIDVIYPFGSVPIALMNGVRCAENRAAPVDRACAAPRWRLGWHASAPISPPACGIGSRRADCTGCATGISASRACSVLPNGWYSRLTMRTVAGPLSQPCARSTSAGSAMSCPLYFMGKRRRHSLGAIPADQPRRLCQAQSRHLYDVGANGSALLLALGGVLLRHQHPLRPAVQLGPVPAPELDRPAAPRKLPDLFRGQLPGFRHADDRFPASRLLLQARLVLETGSPSGPSCIWIRVRAPAASLYVLS